MTSAHTTKAKMLLQLASVNNEALDEKKVVDLVRALLGSKIESKREIAREIGRQAEQIIKNQTAIITSAAPLSKKLQQQIFETLQRHHPALVSAEWCIDSQLLGGFTILVGDTWYDTTIANDLTTIREQLSQ